MFMYCYATFCRSKYSHYSPFNLLPRQTKNLRYSPLNKSRFCNKTYDIQQASLIRWPYLCRTDRWHLSARAGGSLGFRIVSIKENYQNINWLRNGNETRICKSKQQKTLIDLYKKSYYKILMVESQLLCQRKR